MSIRESIGKLRHKRSLAAAVLVAALALAYVLRPILFGPELAVYPARRQDLVQTVVASGRVETPQRVDIGSQVTGAIAAIPVTEGQAVKSGQVLIELEQSEAQAAVEQARAAVSQARARLQQVREVGLPVAQQAVRQAEANLRNARRQYERSKDLYARGFVGQAQLDEALRNLNVAGSQFASASFQLRSLAEDGSDLLLAKATLEQAQASLRMAQARLAYTTIRAPLDGVLIARQAERGDVVQPGKVLMVLSPTGRTQLVVQIDERNIGLLRIGQAALVSADAYPTQRFSARLSYINPAVDPQRGSVEAKFDVPQPPAYLRQDMTVSVDLEVARRDKTIVVPTETVRELNSAAPWVMKVNGRRLVRQPVRVGASGGGNTEIVHGLQPGELVVPVSAATPPEGARVRPVEARRPNAIRQAGS